MYHKHQLPCLHCQPHDYIRMVQHMIERCLLFHMGRDDCVKALAKHANIEPIITLTVWKELLKENKAFFHAYFQSHRVATFRRRKHWGRLKEQKIIIKKPNE